MLEKKITANILQSSCLLLLGVALVTCRQPSRPTEDDMRLTPILLDKADSLLNAGQIAQALQLVDAGFNNLQHPSNIDLWKKYRFKCNYYLFYQVDTLKSAMYADSMFVALKGIDQQYRQEYTQSLFYSGDVLLARHRYEAAFKCYFDGKNYASRYLDSCSVAPFTNKLGLVKYRQRQFAEAIPYLKRAMLESERCALNGQNFELHFIEPQSIINTIALCFSRLGATDSAIHYYQRGLSFIDNNAVRYPNKKAYVEMARGVYYGNLGGIYSKTNQHDALAEEYLKKSIAINKRPGFAVEDALTTEAKLIRLYIRQGRFESAARLLTVFNNGVNALQGYNPENDDKRLDRSDLNRVYAEATKDTGRAYILLQQYHNLRDSIKANDRGKDMVSMNDAFRKNEQQYRLTLMAKNDQMKTFYLVASILFLVLAITILILVLKNLRRTKMHVAELTGLNTKISRHNFQMQGALTALEQSQEENTQLLKVVAHDLRNPVGNMAMLAALLAKAIDRSKEERDMLNMIQNAGKVSLTLINELLQANGSGEELNKEPTDLHGLLYSCVEQMKPRAAHKGQRLTLVDEQFTVDLNSEKMWRVITNLLANAIKFSPPDTVIAVQTTAYKDKVRIAVQDHGIGIPAELADQVFDMFSNAKRPGTAGEQPFGMGLAISKKIITAHQGKLWFESPAEGGTIFYIELPLNN